ncbi:DsbA family protein [Olivibacter sitiensis]|uniref:DsbA family protein n=1 Tax=Olivibacter sitiensis TaxID=376470 RepID=UPI0003F5142F|nr:DsbA family protein [Olivibacter sitiensis]
MATKLYRPVGHKDHITGSKNAEIQIVEYGDYQCPNCGEAFPILKEILNEFDGAVCLVFRHFPLTEIHPMALPAAIAAEAASRQGKFWSMHDLIFANQEALSEALFEDMARELGLEIDRFFEDCQDEAIRTLIEDDFESGVRSGVNGTPTFFVNGLHFDGSVRDLYQMLAENAS